MNPRAHARGILGVGVKKFPLEAGKKNKEDKKHLTFYH